MALAWVTSVATLAGLLATTLPQPDWINQCWMLNRVVAGWLQQGLPPLTLDVAGRQGDPWFLFYGLGVYVPLAPLAWAFGAATAIKLAAVAIHALLGWRLSQLVWHGTGSAAVAGCVSILAQCAVYPVSDLCARAAVVEFFGYELLGIALVSLVLGWIQGQGARHLLIVQALCAATLGALAHAPTFLLGALFLLPVLGAVVWALGRPGLSRNHSLVAATVLALCAVTVALHLAAVLPSLRYLGLRLIGHNHVLTYYGATIDHPLARLSPLPLDLRVDGKGPSGGVLPRLSAPFHGALALVLLGAWLAASRSRGLASRSMLAALLGAFALLSALALSVAIWPSEAMEGVPDVRVATPGSLPSRLLAPAEFAFRLVGAQDLLLILLACLTFARRQGQSPVGAWLAQSRAGWRLLLVCTGVGILGEAMEVNRALGSAESPVASIAAAEAPTLPPTFYAQGTFAMSRAFPLLAPGEPAAVEVETRPSARPFHRRLRADCPSPCSVVTDVVPTRFLAVTVDGDLLPPARLRVSGPVAPESASLQDLRRAERARRVAFTLPAGQHHGEVRLFPWWVQVLSPALAVIAAIALLAEILLVWRAR